MKKKEIKNALDSAMVWIERLLVDPEDTRLNHMDELMDFWNSTIDKFSKRGEIK